VPKIATEFVASSSVAHHLGEQSSTSVFDVDTADFSNAFTIASRVAPMCCGVNTSDPTNDVKSQSKALKPTDIHSIQKARSKIVALQAACNRLPASKFKMITRLSTHVDGGANANIVTHKEMLYWYTERRTKVAMADGVTAMADGFGCALTRIEGSEYIYVLYPSYVMTQNDWPTLSPPALRVYSGLKRASVHALESLELVHANGNVSLFRTRPMERH